VEVDKFSTNETNKSASFPRGSKTKVVHQLIASREKWLIANWMRMTIFKHLMHSISDIKVTSK
jgi:hypothetical protein